LVRLFRDRRAPHPLRVGWWVLEGAFAYARRAGRHPQSTAMPRSKRSPPAGGSPV
jgi:hypothetical protein